MQNAETDESSSQEPAAKQQRVTEAPEAARANCDTINHLTLMVYSRAPDTTVIPYLDAHQWSADMLARLLVRIAIPYHRQSLLQHVGQTFPAFDLGTKYLGKSPLGTAVQECNRPAALYLMRRLGSAEVKKELRGRFKLRVAIVCGRRGLAQVREIVQKNRGSVTSWSRAHTESPLHWAAKANRLDVVQYLVLDLEMDPNQPDRTDGKQRPVECAAFFDHVRIVQWLVAVGNARVFRRTAERAGYWTRLWLLSRCAIDVLCHGWTLRDHFLEPYVDKKTMVLDLRNLRLGNSACRVVADFLERKYSPILTCRDDVPVFPHVIRLENNPRIGAAGVSALMMRNDVVQAIHLPAIPIVAVRMIRDIKLHNVDLRTKFHYPFPTLVTIASWAIARQIRRGKTS
jgi:hypothetical protein